MANSSVEKLAALLMELYGANDYSFKTLSSETLGSEAAKWGELDIVGECPDLKAMSIAAIFNMEYSGKRMTVSIEPSLVDLALNLANLEKRRSRRE